MLQLLTQIEAAYRDGRDDEAVRLLRSAKTEDIQDAATHYALGIWAERLGEIRRAEAEFKLALRDAPNHPDARQRLAKLRADLSGGDSPERLHIAPVSQPPHLTFQPTESDAIAFAHRFAGREGVYARQWVGAAQKAGYTPVYEPFTPAVALQHLVGSLTVGIYPLRFDNTVGFIAFDIDVARYSLGVRPNPLLTRAHEMAVRIAQQAREIGLHAYLEDSGWKGRHVWIFFDPPIPASGARRIGKFLRNALGQIPPELKLELFPKQSTLAPDNLGNLIKLPLGIHLVSNRRCWFIEPSGQPLPDPCGTLHRLQTTTKDQARELMRTIPPMNETTLIAQSELVATPPSPKPSPCAPMPTTEPVYRLDDDVEAQWLFSRCHVLGEIMARVQSHGVLTRDEAAVLTYTLGHLERGHQAVNAALALSLNAESSAFLKSRLRGQPMSCPKIRSRVQSIASAVDCNCQFNPGLGAYPTPLLHLASLLPRHGATPDVGRLSAAQAERLVHDLYRARLDAERSRRLVLDLEHRLLQLMEAHGVDMLTTAAGTLTRQAGDPPRLTLDLSVPNHDHALRHGAGSGTPPTPPAPASPQGPNPAGVGAT